MKLDLLVVAAHPDDAEISVGGTILMAARAGRKVGVLDVTRGEMGTRGSAADRERETRAATELMGLSWRGNLGLPDSRVVADLEARESLARVLRETRPGVVISHHTEDLHPDHSATGQLTREAWYLAGLSRIPERDGDPHPAHRPERLYHFMSHVEFSPTFVVDIGPVWEEKRAVVACYASQLAPRDDEDRGEHFLFGADILQRMESKARFYGEKIGALYGEPLLSIGPVPLADPLLLG